MTPRPKDPAAWETVVRLGREIPESEWSKVPNDASVNLDRYLYGEKEDRFTWELNEAGRQWSLRDALNPYGIVTVAGYFHGNGVPYFRIIVPCREGCYLTLEGAMDASEEIAKTKALETQE